MWGAARGLDTDESTLVGLGYHHSSQKDATTGDTDTAAKAAVQEDVVAVAIPTTGLVQTLMQECLVYHEEQEVLRRRREQPSPSFSSFSPQQTATTMAHAAFDTGGAPAMVWVPDSESFAVPPSNTSSNNDTNNNKMMVVDQTVVQSDTAKTMQDPSSPQLLLHGGSNERVKQGKARAHAILARFQQEQQQQQEEQQTQQLLANNHNNDTHKGVQEISSTSTPNWAALRQADLDRETQRKHLALLHNLAYLARREQERTSQLDQQVMETGRALKVSLQQQQQQQHDRFLRIKNYQQQQQQQQSTGATTTVTHSNCHDTTGVASSSSHRLSKRQRSSADSLSSTAAIYIAGLPVGSTTPNATICNYDKDKMDTNNKNSNDKNTNDDPVHWEAFIRQLFGHYGTIAKVHLYRQKESTNGRQPGQLKGDALVVYQVKSTHSSSPQDLIATVCAQMNGAELACGTVLTVEPAFDGTSHEQVQSGQPAVSSESCSVSIQTGLDHGTTDLDSGKSNIATITSIEGEQNLSLTNNTVDDDELDDFFDSM